MQPDKQDADQNGRTQVFFYGLTRFYPPFPPFPPFLRSLPFVFFETSGVFSSTSRSPAGSNVVLLGFRSKSAGKNGLDTRERP
jgi:hypothetical protein